MLEKLSQSTNIPDLIEIISFAMDLLVHLPDDVPTNPLQLEFSQPIEVDATCDCGCHNIVEVYSLGTFHCLSCGKKREVI